MTGDNARLADAVPVCSCGGSCAQIVMTITLPGRNAPAAIVRNVPAEVCQTCGETQFSIPVTVKLMALLKGSQAPEDVAIVPVYNLAK